MCPICDCGNRVLGEEWLTLYQTGGGELCFLCTCTNDRFGNEYVKCHQDSDDYYFPADGGICAQHVVQHESLACHEQQNYHAGSVSFVQIARVQGFKFRVFVYDT